jgi:ureidoglycolate dehydrogenase (NAD+)
MAYYTLMAAEQGLAGIAVVCNPPNMAPYGAKVAGLHNSPISLAVPAQERRPLVLDMATSVAAGGKLSLAIDKGIEIPLGWALDKEGKPTTHPAEAKALLPFGGYKGSGLAMLFECFSSLMVGNPLVARKLTGQSIHPGSQNSFVAALDIELFTDLETYKHDVDELIDLIKGLPKADGVDEILVPGEIEDRVYAERTKEGIPLPDGTAHNLAEVAQKLGVPMPAWLSN